jgi:hypothetical protein
MIVTLESARANADEFTVFKVKDTSYIESVKAAMKSHSDEMLVSVLNYKPDEVTRINNALVAVKGKYVFYIISEDNVKVEAAIETLFK